jgi:hypothetical protein
MTKKEKTEGMITLLKAKLKNYRDLKKGTTNVNTIEYCDRGIATTIASLKVLGVEVK